MNWPMAAVLITAIIMSGIVLLTYIGSKEKANADRQG